MHLVRFLHFSQKVVRVTLKRAFVQLFLIILLYYFEGRFVMFLDLRNQLKLSAFTSITAQIKLRYSHHVSQTLKVMFTMELQCQEC